LPLWPWAAAACVFGLGAVRNPRDKRFWHLQAASFVALLVIEVPWAFSRASDTAGWNIVAEWCYFAYYACQLTSATRTRAGAVSAVVMSAAAAATLSVLAVTRVELYNGAWPSYFLYLTFDVAMAVVFWRARRTATAAWAWIFAALAVTSAVVFATDVLDMLSYEEWIHMSAGMKTDILWTVPPLCYALVARLGRQRLEPTT
jgi:hypothetical protein